MLSAHPERGFNCRQHNAGLFLYHHKESDPTAKGRSNRRTQSHAHDKTRHVEGLSIVRVSIPR